MAKPNVIELKKLSSAIDLLMETLGPDTSLRQLSILLHVSLGGESGIEQSQLQVKSGSSQAATSRNIKALGPGAGLVEYFLDQRDIRRKLLRTTSTGDKLLATVIRKLTP